MIHEARERYEAISIPSELSSRIEASIEKGKRRRKWMRVPKAFSTVAAACVLLFVMVNVSPSVAGAMDEIPVLGDICRLFTIREYFEESNSFIADVKIPHVDASQMVGDSSWTERINKTIEETIDAEVADSMERAEEYYKAYVETGGKPEEFIPVLIDVSYEVKHAEDNILSFVIYKYEALASSYQQNYYYNLDITTGEALTLPSLLGEHWVDIIEEDVIQQLALLPQSSQDMLFLDYTDLQTVIEQDIGFYINTSGEIVVVFPKYSIGAGALGLLEFTVAA